MHTKTKKKPKPRIPREAFLKLGSYPISTKKGKKGYDRKRLKQQIDNIAEERIIEDNN
jgi:hypothetical protein